MATNDNNRYENKIISDLSVPLVDDSDILQDCSNNDTINTLTITFDVNEKGILVPTRNLSVFDADGVVAEVSQDLQLKSNKENENKKIHETSAIVIKPPNRMSTRFNTHLRIPSPIKKSSNINASINRIGAISSKEWRDFENKKEEEKKIKKDAVIKRKLERSRIREEKLKKTMEQNEKRKNIKRRRVS